MKKTLCLFGAIMVASSVFTSCAKEEETQTKNYYGVQPDEDHGTPKEAYYAFFGGLICIVFLVIWLLKKMSKK